MNEQVIIYNNDSTGQMTICFPTGELPIEQVLLKDCPPGAVIIDKSKLPFQDLDFRNAWEYDQVNVLVNIDKAREITKDRLRIERKPLLEKLDIDFQRALETNSDTSLIVAEKQRLRDITQIADTVSTLEELRSIKATITG